MRVTILQHLTPAQLRVLHLALDGCSDRQIAEQLCVSRRTVHVHLMDVRIRLGIDAAGGPRWLVPLARQIGRSEVAK